MMMATTRFQRKGTLPLYKGMNSQTYKMKKQWLYFVKEKAANHKSRWKLLLPHTKRKQKWTFVLTSRRLLKIIKLPLFKAKKIYLDDLGNFSTKSFLKALILSSPVHLPCLQCGWIWLVLGLNPYDGWRLQLRYLQSTILEGRASIQSL